MNSDLVGIWLEHCAKAKHVTQGEALEHGKKPNRAKYATYETSPSGQRIYCGLKGCDWTAHVDDLRKAEVR